MVYVLALAISGLFIGALGRLLVPGRQPMGCVATTLCGLGGALVGGLVGRLIWGPNYVPGLLMAVAGATLLIWLLYGSRRHW